MDNRSYAWELLPRLASEVEHARRPAAGRDLGELLAIVARQSGPALSLRKMRCAQILSACLRAARRGGGPSEVLLAEHIQFLKRLDRARSWAVVRRSMQGYVRRLIGQVRPLRKSRMERIVAGLIADLRQAPGEARSLAQYAAELDLSQGHLSRSIRAITGRPFRETLRRVRCEAAGKLLAETDQKIGSIARQVGWLSASQFASEFRKQMGVTPSRVRRRAQARR